MYVISDFICWNDMPPLVKIVYLDVNIHRQDPLNLLKIPI